MAFTAAGLATVDSDATPRSLTIDAGTSTATFGAAVGSVAGLASLSVTAATTFLANGVTTADVAGNDVSITGNIVLMGDMTLTTDCATHDGTISITGTVTGIARSLALLGGTISTGAVTTSGGTRQDGSTVTMTATAGGINLGGSITTADRLTLTSNGPVTQTAAIVASQLELLGTASFTLTSAGNDVDVLAVDISGSVSYADANDLTIGTVGSTVGITTGNPGPGGGVTITALGYLTVDATIDTSSGSGGVLTATGVVFHALPVLGAGDISLSGLNHAPSLDLDDDNSSGQSGAEYAMKITVDHTKVSGTTDLLDFPLLINLTSVELKDTLNSGHVAQSDGGDIRFTSADGITQLDHELEVYDPTTGALVAWVRVPVLDQDNDTVVYLYYGNTSAADQSNQAGVWDSSFEGVWHLGEDQAGTGSPGLYRDSTSNGHHGDDFVSDTGKAGVMGKGQQFDGSADFIDIPLNTGSTATVSAWAYTSVADPVDMLWCFDSNNTGPDLYFVYGVVALNTWNGAGNPFTSWPADKNQWHLYTTVIAPGDGNTQLYIDGQFAGTASYADPTSPDFHISSSPTMTG